MLRLAAKAVYGEVYVHAVVLLPPQHATTAGDLGYPRIDPSAGIEKAGVLARQLRAQITDLSNPPQEPGRRADHDGIPVIPIFRFANERQRLIRHQPLDHFLPARPVGVVVRDTDDLGVKHVRFDDERSLSSALCHDITDIV